MKKILLIVLSLAVAVSISGCIGGGGNSLEGVNTADASAVTDVKYSDYEDNLAGLEEYLVALKYIPEKAVPTDMMYAVIGAKDGDRYNFTVNGSAVYVELYEYDPTSLNDEGKRVISEIEETGKFHVFQGDNENAAFEAELSYNRKYMMIYTGDEKMMI